MVRLLDRLQSAQSNEDKEIHFALALDSLFKNIEKGDELSEDTRLELEEMEGDYVLPEIVSNLKYWYNEENFESALDGLSDLEDAVKVAKSNNWLNTATQYHYQRIRLKSNLQGHSISDEAEGALDFIETNKSQISPRFILPLIEIVLENTGDISDDKLKRWEKLTGEVSQSHQEENEFNWQREYLRLLNELKYERGTDTGEVENRLIDSYRKEAELAGERSKLQKADILRSGIAECIEYMSKNERREWKKEALEARKSGMQSELKEIRPSDIDMENIDAEGPEEAIANEMEHNTQVYIKYFKNMKRATGSGSYALYCLALSSSLIPDPNRIRLSAEEYVFSTMFQKKLFSPEAHTFSVDPSDVESIPTNYNHFAAGKMTSLGNALYRLIKEGHLSISDVFHLFFIGNSLSADTEAFLNEGVIDLYDENHIQALFILIPHLEGAIVDTLRSIGRPAYTVVDRGTRQQLLGGLFRQGKDLFGKHFSLYLRYRYTSREGLNLRNRISHGQLRYINANYLNTVLTLFDILKCMITLNGSSYIEYFGIPQKTLSPPTYYGRDVDLTLFTDLNKNIIGYGRSDDEHTLLVIREDHHKETTEIFVDQGRINRYQIDDIGLSRKKLKDEIDNLRDENLKIPENINFTWLDKEDLILHTVKEVINEKIESTADSVTRNVVLEEVKSRGINETVAKIALRKLQEDEEILVFEIHDNKEILLSKEKIQIFENLSKVDGVGSRIAWQAACHFDSKEEFCSADEDELQEVSGVGPERARKITDS
ncbi:hypothetical protein AKJ52_00490 [candidate division MSBL1 archaeon SCGC-AAA382C18]|uniref:Helix-hairpin-helix DNA-binding motif class 1 domain-containing protein n=1 Tax=candidate division MSBL1 archaeon SCGC-AAA382C18 TaxID=1698281 RepID=A0A133VLN6_9EURY|nr:hypothetical protein AKJ52_00490 [candidate division MSBL1 archaeon SCGC-AAA382C18]